MDILSPVTYCIATCVFLVRLLRIDENAGASYEMSGSVASAAYQEKTTDSAGTKLAGALANALVFVTFVAVATTIIFCLFKHGCSKVIWAYMGVSGLVVFGGLGGALGAQVLQALDIPCDVVTFAVCAVNFSVVGVLAVFFVPAPIAVKQGYLVAIASMVAFYFTRMAEWSTWVLLCAMALYDLFAVLTPVGPLKAIVELAQERDEEIPALVYAARPRRMRRVRTRAGGRGAGGGGGGGGGAGGEGGGDVAAAGAGAVAGGANERQPLLRPPSASAMDDAGGTFADQDDDDDGGGGGGGGVRIKDGMKLGLGDFIFYAVLVGRAAMYDLFVALLCYLAVAGGLVYTLVELGRRRRALPALPASIASGVAAYLAGRYVLEPMIYDGLRASSLE